MPLRGFIRDATATPEQAGALLGRSAAPGAAVLDTAFTGGTLGNPTDMVVRFGERSLQRADEVLSAAPKLSADEATAQFGVDGHLKFDKPVTVGEAAYRRRNKLDELARGELLSRNETVSPLWVFGASMAGQVVDPLNMAINTVPILGEGRIAEQLGMAARVVGNGRRALLTTSAIRGGIEAGLTTAATEGVQYGIGGLSEGRDYGPEDALASITAGTVLGGGFGLALGALSPTPGDVGSLASRLEHQESRGRQSAVSPKGAIGVMQLMPDTARAAAKRLGMPFDEVKLRTDAAYNRALGQEELRHLLERYDGDELLASAAYNAGPGAVDKWIARFGDPRSGAISHADFAAKIPFSETRDYVVKVGTAGGPVARAAADFPPLPRAVAMLDEASRQGTLARAIDQLADNSMVDAGRMMDADLARGIAVPRLDETMDAPLGINARLGAPSTIETPRGAAVPVREAIVEADDLLASHDRDLIRRAEYPDELASRQATPRVLDERVRALEAAEPAASIEAAPLVSRNGLVEGGTDAAIALQRIADDPARAGAYRAALEARGHDLSGFERPVLVKLREAPLSGAERVRLARELDADAGLAPRANDAPVDAAEQPVTQAQAIHRQSGARLRGELDEPVKTAPAELPAPFVTPDKLTPEALVSADPSLKALMDDTDRMAAELEAAGVDQRAIEAATREADRDKPKTIVEAIRAAAFCLAAG